MWGFCSLFLEDIEALEIFEKEVCERGIKRFDSFSIDPKSTEFSDLIEELFFTSEYVSESPEITLHELNDFIQKICFKMQKYKDRNFN